MHDNSPNRPYAPSQGILAGPGYQKEGEGEGQRRFVQFLR